MGLEALGKGANTTTYLHRPLLLKPPRDHGVQSLDRHVRHLRHVPR
jgi:hypothetical protein